MKKEEYAVLELLKYEYDSSFDDLFKDNDINWISVLGYLTYHRVAGLVYEKVNNVNARLLDYPVFFAAYMINQSQKIRVLKQNEYLIAISRILTDHNIQHAFLKGVVLSNTIYAYGSRAGNDIDLLVSKRNLDDVTVLLQQLGFIQGKFDYKNNTIRPFSGKEIKDFVSTRGETAPFVMMTDDLAVKTIDVDVNFSLDWTPDMSEEIVDAFLADRMLITTKGNEPIYTLNYERNFLELCIHLYKDSVLMDIIKKRKILDLYKFVDVYYFLKEKLQKMDIDKLYGEISRFKLKNPVYFVLTYIYRLFPDIKCFQLDFLRDKLKCDDIMNTLFDQYNTSSTITATDDLVERIFSYNLIDKYKNK